MTPTPVARAVVAWLALAPATARAATYVVAPGGNDGNAGTALQPWLTLQKAANTVVAGDLVTVRAGNYVGFDIRTSGQPGKEIVFRADPGVAITAPNPKTPDGVNVEGASWIVIEGFTANAMPRAGFRAVLCGHVTFRGNKGDSNMNWGLFTGFCDDLLLEGNSMSRSVREHGIYTSNSGDRPTIRRNVLFSNSAAGLHMNGDASLGGDGVISGALVEENVIYDNGRIGGSGINCDGVQDSVIRNNLLYGNHASGISLYRIDGGGPAARNLIVNNTIVNAADSRWVLNIQSAATNTTIYNNVLYNNHAFRGVIDISGDSLPGLASDYNAVMDRFTSNGGNNVLTLAAWRMATGQDANSFVAAPAALFVDAMNNDYHLKPQSPAVDKGGNAKAPPTDLDGVARPQNGLFDVGAYELRAAPPDGGVPDLSSPPMDLARPADLAVVADLSTSPADQAAPRDQAAGDLAAGTDLAAARDLASGPLDAAGTATDLATASGADLAAPVGQPESGCGCTVAARRPAQGGTPAFAGAALLALLLVRSAHRRRVRS